jgi:hypothetical protein
MSALRTLGEGWYVTDTALPQAIDSLPPLRPHRVFGRALRTHRERFFLIAGAAIAVFAPLAVAATVIERWSYRYHSTHDDSTSLSILVVTFVGTSAVLFGSAFYAGLLDRIVGEHQHGHERHTVWDILRKLPYRRLIAANILLAIIVSAGLLLFVVPGLVLLTLFALVGPLINIEHQTVFGAFRRSACLVRPVFLTAFLAITIPIELEHALEHWVEHFVLHRPHLIASFVLSGLAAATIGAFVGLVEVTLTYELVSRDRHVEQDQGTRLSTA